MILDCRLSNRRFEIIVGGGSGGEWVFCISGFGDGINCTGGTWRGEKKDGMEDRTCE